MKAAMMIKAPAKINLGLKVLRRRPDGYHDIISLMQQVSLGDIILLEALPEPGWRFFCSEASLSGDDNLVCRAAALLAERAGGQSTRPGVKISLYKNIPVAAGLGGGSSDAAAALKGLNAFWNLRLSRDELLETAALIGSDVPYCLQGGTVLAQGRGELLETLPDLPFFWTVLAIPSGAFISTELAYSSLEQAQFGSPSLGPLIAAVMSRNRKSLHDWFARGLTNTFEEAVISKQPALRGLRGQFLDAGLQPAMSGSGPTYFALCDSLILARKAARALQESGNRTFLCWTIPGPNKQRE